MRLAVLAVVFAGLAHVAFGEITFEFQRVDNSAVTELDGYVTQDMVIHTTSDWRGAQLIVTLDAPGQVYQHPYTTSADSPDPNVIANGVPPLMGPMPALAFDTYISNGTLGTSVMTLSPVDLGGADKVFNRDEISIAWFTMASDEIGDLPLARISLAETANGRWSFLATASPSGGPKIQLQGKVINGVMYYAGDVSADGVVGQLDLDMILDNWDAAVPAGHKADLNDDGDVNQADLDILRRYWGGGYFPVKEQGE